MPGFVDFKQLATDIDIEAVANHLGLHLKRSQKDLRTQCPACQTDDERSLQIIPETNSFRCFAAQVSGDCISLFAHVQGTGMYKAAKDLQELFSAPANAGRTTPAPATAPQKPEGRNQPAPTFDGEAYAKGLDPAHDLVAAIGFPTDVARAIGLGYTSKGVLRGTVAIPVRLEDGTLAGFMGVTEARLPSRWNLDKKVVPFQKKGVA